MKIPQLKPLLVLVRMSVFYDNVELARHLNITYRPLPLVLVRGASCRSGEATAGAF